MPTQLKLLLLMLQCTNCDPRITYRVVICHLKFNIISRRLS